MMFEMLEVDDVWFQQDGVTVHRAQKSINCLTAMLSGHLISHFVTLPGHVSLLT
jgi:hypothetical protein